MPSATAPKFNHARLREWRQESGLRLEDVAARSGVSFSHLRALEDRGGNPSGETVAAIAAVFGKPMDELYARPGAQ